MNADEIQVKDYQVHEPPLGEGSYGRVFRATYRGISERAMKVFRPGAVDLSTMARELEKLSSVAEHHGIVTLHDFDLLADPPYYVMGLHADQDQESNWETRTLERLCGHVEHREAWRLLKEVADALAYLHRNHIIHCDIKPTNILLTDETPFGVKICDFGQSRGDALEGFQPAGTPLYASPEQLRHPRDSAEGKGFRWDVYSFGVVAYKLLTGRLPRLQGLAVSDRESYDPEATIAETSLESTLAESKNVDGEHLAMLTEKESEIVWPSDLYVPHDRKELIERCLSLDPSERFADMREVFSAMQDSDQHRMVKRARRLNALFATLLVVAIWATGFALIQARRAHRASADAMESREEAEKLVFFIVNKLNREELSGPSLDELYDHIAENAETYLDKLPKTRRSVTLLRISANSAQIRGRQALEENDLDLALEHFQNAYEIRSQLAESTVDLPELGWLASNDLMQIGSIQAKQEDWTNALETFEKVKDWRTRDLNPGQPQTLPQIRRIIETQIAIADVEERSGDASGAIETYAEAIKLYEETAAVSESSSEPNVARDLIPLLEGLARLQFAEDAYTDAKETYLKLVDVAAPASQLETVDAWEAAMAEADALHSLGRIATIGEEEALALDFYRDEVRVREMILGVRPYDPEMKMDLAVAYESMANTLDVEEPAQRSVALYHLRRAVSLLGELPAKMKAESQIQARMLALHEKISAILEMEE